MNPAEGSSQAFRLSQDKVCYIIPFHSLNTKQITTMAMTVEIKNGKLCIEIDLEKPTPSSSGKTLVAVSYTHLTLPTILRV